MDGTRWPLLLYEENKYDKDDPWKGFMRNELLVKVCCETDLCAR